MCIFESVHFCTRVNLHMFKSSLKLRDVSLNPLRWRPNQPRMLQSVFFFKNKSITALLRNLIARLFFFLAKWMLQLEIWPTIVIKSPLGWTVPRVIDGRPCVRKKNHSWFMHQAWSLDSSIFISVNDICLAVFASLQSRMQASLQLQKATQKKLIINMLINC